MQDSGNFHISFGYKDTVYKLNLVKEGQSDHTVKINDTKYAVFGDKDKLQKACKILSSISFSKDIHLTEVDLRKKLSVLNTIPPTVEKASRLGLYTLKGSEISSAKITNSSSDNITVKTLKIQDAYQTLVKDLEKHADEHLKKGALLVQVIGIPGSEENPIVFGNLSATSEVPVTKETVGRTGSGCKLWTALLTKIVTTKYHQYISMEDGLGKFAPEEALRKFARKDADGNDFVDAKLAKEITVEALISMTAGLEYEDRAPKKDTGTTFDQVMRGNEELKDGSIHMLFHPRDKITLYSNYVALTAYPIEKAYKKVLAEEYIDQEKKLGETTQGKTLPLELQKLSLGELLKFDEAYIKGAYLYDLIDHFLADVQPDLKLDKFTYDRILKKEFFQPMGMSNSGFSDIDKRGTSMDLTFENDATQKDESQPPEKNHPMMFGMSFGRTTLSDAAKLTKGLTEKNGLVAENGKDVLLSKTDLDDVFKSHSQNPAWGLAAIELSSGGHVVDKGGWVNQDQYTCWVDRNSGVGLIAMCNCGRRPDKILAEFKEKVEEINYPHIKPITKEKEGTSLEIPIKNYFDHPLERSQVQVLFDGTRGRVALLFDYEKDQTGILHWSGTPLNVKKLEDGTFCITNLGRFEGIIVRKVPGAHNKENNYLYIGDNAFVEIEKNRIPSDEKIKYAQNEFKNFCGIYSNYKHREHTPLKFTIEKDDKGTVFLSAGEIDREIVPQNIVEVKENAISFNGHDRQPPDKIFRFVREAEDKPWLLQVTDYISVNEIIETRNREEDDLLFHQERINAIDSNLVKASNAAQKIFHETGEIPKCIDTARSLASHGEFASAKKACAEALEELQKAESNETDAEAKILIRESLSFAKEACNDCDIFLTELNKAANAIVETPDKSLIEAAAKELKEAREFLQEILEGKNDGDIEDAKAKVSDLSSKCHDLSWASGNAEIARKQMLGKAQLAASLIPKATAEKVFALATQELGTLEKPGTVFLDGGQYEVAHDLLSDGYQIIRLPNEEKVLGEGAWNVVVRVSNVSNKCFQALRKTLGEPQSEEERIRSIEIYKDVGKLQGTTVGPEAMIRNDTGGLLSSLYSDDVIKWLHMMPPPNLRWECFQSTLSSFIEFAKAGNVHGDIHPGNLSVVYDKRIEKEGPIYAAPGTIKIEDLDGACHIIEGFDTDNNPIYSKKAVMDPLCKFATQLEVDEWIRCLNNKDLEGIAKVRFGQDILAMGITLYQILTLDFDITNLYLNKECSPLTDRNGIVEGKFEEGIFTAGKPNLDSVRLALEEYEFLTNEQKEKIIKFIALSITQDTKERAKLQDLEDFKKGVSI